MKFGLESDISADWLQFKFHQNRTTRTVSNTVYIGKNEFLPFFLVFCHVWIKNQFDTLDAWTTPWDNCDLLSKLYEGDLERETDYGPNRIVTFVIKLWLLGHSTGLANMIKTLLTNYVRFKWKWIIFYLCILDRFVILIVYKCQLNE